ncbi:MAG: methyltransferase domain-containing protein [Alphaproteobacteria bacterium]|nr:methyltransferase domain-containing protein [Alphaproteobacteria bacterium]
MTDALQRAAAALNANALDEAEVHARTALDAAPNQPRAYDLLALALERKGHSDAALAVLQRGVEALPDAMPLHNSLALLYARMGRLREAEDQLLYAIGFEPNEPELAANLGIILASQRRFPEADQLLRQAIARAPGTLRYHVELGRLNLAGGRPNAAGAAFGEAIKLGRAHAKTGKTAATDPQIFNPYFDALNHLAGIAFNDGKKPLALSLFQEAIHFGAGEPARLQFANHLVATTFTAPQLELKPIIIRALREAWILPSEIVRAATPLITLEPAFQTLLGKLDSKALLASDEARTVASDPLLLTFLNDALVTDPALERVLTAMRAAFLRTTSANERTTFRTFAAVLANQCFTNEYAFAETPAERAAVDELLPRLQDDTVEDSTLLLAAAYRPLNTLPAAERLRARIWPESIEPVITRQLREPATERRLIEAIPKLTPIEDPTSKAVQRQYEENPFPRWVRTPVTERRFPLDAWLRLHFPNLNVASKADRVEILVAGCGTGQEAIASAQRFADANVLAIDLSMPSLAYALRKSAELKINNIHYAQGDILALSALDRRFDVIECAGVLHHLADPLAGWRVLSELLAPGGIMLMALYSEQGRKDLAPAIDLVRMGKYGSAPAELRRFRADVLALPANHPARSIVTTRDDFYNLSMLRDLIFHVQEHRFDIPMIANAMRTLGLEFCGFGLAPAERKRFHDRFGADADVTSLEKWDTLEREHPEIFSAMYHFVARKPL